MPDDLGLPSPCSPSLPKQEQWHAQCPWSRQLLHTQDLQEQQVNNEWVGSAAKDTLAAMHMYNCGAWCSAEGCSCLPYRPGACLPGNLL